MSERCKRTSERTSKWPNTSVCIFGCSGPLYDDLRFGGEVGVALASSKPRFDLAWRQVRFGRESVDIRIGPAQREIDHF